MPLNGPILQLKTLHLAHELEIQDICAAGADCKWFSIYAFKVNGKSSDDDMNVADN